MLPTRESSELAELNQKAIEAIRTWYENLPKTAGFPPKGAIAGALVILGRLQKDFDLKLSNHLATGGAQIRGAGRAALKKILADFGEERPFLSEGGRTNRGLPGQVRDLLANLGELGIAQFPADPRGDVLRTMQSWLVERVREFHQRQRIRISFDPAKTTAQLVKELLGEAKQNRKDGPLAQHLVGAKLQLRYPDLQIENNSYSTADLQLGRAGDFLVGDTAFHVTVAPMPPVYERCQHNLQRGIRPYLLVPDEKVVGAAQNCETMAPGKVTVLSIETFVAANVDEISQFSSDALRREIRSLLRIYNDRVDAAERDKSFLIEIPSNL